MAESNGGDVAAEKYRLRYSIGFFHILAFDPDSEEEPTAETTIVSGLSEDQFRDLRDNLQFAKEAAEKEQLRLVGRNRDQVAAVMARSRRVLRQPVHTILFTRRSTQILERPSATGCSAFAHSSAIPKHD